MNIVLSSRTHKPRSKGSLNLITSFVKLEELFIYLKPGNWEKKLIEIRQRLDLKELVRGGNIHLLGVADIGAIIQFYEAR